MRTLPAIAIISLLGLCTCVKPPSYSEIPEIEFNKLSVDSVAHASGLTVTINFKDGDGDLGTDANETFPIEPPKSYASFTELFDTACANPKNFDLFVVDTRTNPDLTNPSRFLVNMTPYQVPIIPAKGTSKAISGDIQFFVNDIETIPGRVNSDTLSFLVMVRDQSGHCSNIIKTSPIRILR